MKKSVGLWQLIGFAFTSVAGTLLHFLYDWSGQSVFVAPFSAINESIWEHMKLLFFPMFLYALFERRILGKEYHRFWFSKLVGITMGLTVIPVLYYTYTGALGVSAYWFNITIFFIAAAISFRLEAKLLKSGRKAPLSSTAAFLLLCLIGSAFLLFTFFPPQIPLFQDPVTGLYGLQPK